MYAPAVLVLGVIAPVDAFIDKPAGEATPKAKEPTPEEKAAADAKAVEDKKVAEENKKLLERIRHEIRLF